MDIPPELTTLAVQVKLAALIVIYLFVPLSAFTYYVFRRDRHQTKVERVLRVLDVDKRDTGPYRTPFTGRYLLVAVIYCSVVAMVGLAALMFSQNIEVFLGIDSSVNTGEGRTFPVDDSLLMLGMAFLGAYLWGSQYVFRRYVNDDLNPGVFYGLSVRMLLAGALAVVIFNAYEALAGSGGSPQGQEGVGKTMWPALAFVLGMFPQRGLSWLRSRIPIFSPEADPSVRPMPLEMIEGITVHDRLRLEECDIDSCYDLATTDFVPLVINTPYSARMLIDWMLQAKLCVYCGDAVKDLRRNGIRTIVDLEGISNEEIERLTDETSVTRSALERAIKYLERSQEVARLRQIGHLLGIYAHAIGDARAPAQPGENIWHATAPQTAEAGTAARTPAK